MAGSDTNYLVGPELVGYRVASLVEDRRKTELLKERFREEVSASPPVAVSAVPVSPDGSLTPDVIYDSSAGLPGRYYLPRYTLHVTNGRYASSLKWRSQTDDPNGPLAWLTIELAANSPNPADANLREIDHQTLLRLTYYMPVQAQDGSRSDGPPLSIEIGMADPVSPGLRRCRRSIFAKEEFDRIYQVMTDAQYKSSLQIRCLAVVGRRTWKQVVPWRVKPAVQESMLLMGQPLYTETLSPKTLSTVRAGVLVPSSKRIEMIDDRSGDLEESGARERRRHGPAMHRLPSTVTITEPPTVPRLHEAVIHHSPVEPAAPPARARVERATLPAVAVEHQPGRVLYARSNSQPLAEMLEKTNATVLEGATTSRAVPLTIWLDDQGQPALLKVAAEARQSIAPFAFPTATNAYMFDMPGDMHPSTNHVLLKETVIGADGSVQATLYQDSVFRDRFYFQPQEFRLSRLGSLPYLPDLVVALFDAVGQEQGAPGLSILYRVEFAYRARPYIEPRILDMARVQLAGSGVQARFTALEPVSSQLILLLPKPDGSGSLREVARPEARVNFDEGIIDSIELSSTEFERIFSFFQQPSGVGLEGRIEATLFDGTTVRMPLRLSLSQMTGALFDRTFQKADTGEYRVTLRNRIESDVVIDHVYPVRLDATTVASPTAVTLPLIVKPNQTVTINYQVPANAVVNDIDPVLSTTIVTNHDLVWRSLMVNSGYSSDVFTIKVGVNPQFFGPPPAGAEPLTGVRVEFESDASVALTATAPQTTAILRIPLLPRLMKDATAQRYRFRVTNVHASGEGARSNWTTSEGDLEVAPAPMGGA